VDRPFYSFKRSRHARKASQQDLSVRYDTLQLTTDFDDYTELATIFLAPEARGSGVGRLLSLGRLAFIHAHRMRFADRLMADVRGWVDEEGKSPFWEHLTSKFIQTGFDEADRLSSEDGTFIVELCPALPIMLNLLPARTIISQSVFQATGGGVTESDEKYLHFTGGDHAFRAALGPAYPSAQKAGRTPCEILGTITPQVALAEDRRVRA